MDTILGRALGLPLWLTVSVVTGCTQAVDFGEPPLARRWAVELVMDHGLLETCEKLSVAGVENLRVRGHLYGQPDDLTGELSRGFATLSTECASMGIDRPLLWWVLAPAGELLWAQAHLVRIEHRGPEPKEPVKIRVADAAYVAWSAGDLPSPDLEPSNLGVWAFQALNSRGLSFDTDADGTPNLEELCGGQGL